MNDNKQTNWEEEFDKRFNEDTLVSAHTDWTPKAIKNFISKTISQEKEKWEAELKKSGRCFCYCVDCKYHDEATPNPDLLQNK